MMQTRDEFEESMCKGRGWTREFYRQHFVSLPCNCEDAGIEIPHWAKISLTDGSGVLNHLAFQCPDQNQLMAAAHDELVHESCRGTFEQHEEK